MEHACGLPPAVWLLFAGMLLPAVSSLVNEGHLGLLGNTAGSVT